MSILDRILAVFRSRSERSLPRAIRYKEQKIYAMVNTLTLSTEMDTLYLIDNGRAIAFPLDGKGVLIGTLKGQLTVATAMEDPIAEGETDLPDASVAKAGRGSGGQSIKLPITDNTQWTFLFNKRFQKLFAIGATDIDISLRAGAASANCVLTEFNLSNFVISLRKVKNALVIEEMTKGTAS